MNYKDLNRRVGEFTLTMDLIENYPELVMKLMGQVIIVRAECLYYERMMKYIAICPDFPITLEGYGPTKMDAIITSDHDTYFSCS